MRLAVVCLVALGCQAPVVRPISSTVPRQAEPYHPRGRVIVTDTSIELLDQIGFVGGSAAFTPESAPQLDALADTLHGNPFRALEVQAFASDVPEAFQEPLSELRARRLVDYLVRRGVDRRMLHPIGIAPAPPGSGNHPNFVIWR